MFGVEYVKGAWHKGRTAAGKRAKQDNRKSASQEHGHRPHSTIYRCGDLGVAEYCGFCSDCYYNIATIHELKLYLAASRTIGRIEKMLCGLRLYQVNKKRIQEGMAFIQGGF
jgi:hypothetical protein